MYWRIEWNIDFKFQNQIKGSIRTSIGEAKALRSLLTFADGSHSQCQWSLVGAVAGLLQFMTQNTHNLIYYPFYDFLSFALLTTFIRMHIVHWWFFSRMQIQLAKRKLYNEMQNTIRWKAHLCAKCNKICNMQIKTKYLINLMFNDHIFRVKIQNNRRMKIMHTHIRKQNAVQEKPSFNAPVRKYRNVYSKLNLCVQKETNGKKVSEKNKFDFMQKQTISILSKKKELRRWMQSVGQNLNHFSINHFVKQIIQLYHCHVRINKWIFTISTIGTHTTISRTVLMLQHTHEHMR